MQDRSRIILLALITRNLRVLFGEGNGTPLQYSCLENPMDGGAWWAAIHGVEWQTIYLFSQKDHGVAHTELMVRVLCHLKTLNLALG